MAAGAWAYFRWLNAHGGVFGRRIGYRVLNDHGNKRFVPSLVHELVQGDAVFAVFGADGVPGKAVSGFLDTSGVPDVFAGSGCSCVDSPALPEVFGWSLGDVREGKILGAYIAQHYQDEKVGVLYRPGRAGRDLLDAFTGAASGVRLAAKITVADPSGAVAGAKAACAAGAKVLVTFTSPAMSAQLASAPRRLPLVVAGSGLADRLPDGVITDGFLPSAGAPAKSAAGSWVALFRTIRGKYLKDLALSPAVIDGMASAYEMAAAMFRRRPAADASRPGRGAERNAVRPGGGTAGLFGG